jgi:hypothetical protein
VLSVYDNSRPRLNGRTLDEPLSLRRGRSEELQIVDGGDL